MDAKRAFALSLALLVLIFVLPACGILLKGRENPKMESDLPTEQARHPHAVEVGGVSIYVDDSKYERYQPAAEICTPISDGPLDEFVPSTGYGDVFPYVAGRLFTSSEDGYGWGGSYLYGLADSKGRMLTGGIYTAAYPLYCYVPGSYENRQLPFLQVTRYRDASVIHHEDEYGDWDEINAVRESALISMDGTFLLPFSNCSYQGFPDCIVATEGSVWDDDMGSRQRSFTVYDLHGKLLFDSSVLDIDPGCDHVWVQESEGILQVTQVWYDEEDPDRDCIDYYDLTGKHRLGPYKNGTAFTDGLACVSVDGTCYGYVDRNGRWVIAPQYLYCEEFRNGFTVQRRYSGAEKIMLVLDTAGREVFSTEADWVYLQDGMIQVDYGYDSDRMASYSEYYDLEGNLLLEGWISVEQISDSVFLVWEEGKENTARLVDLTRPEKEITLTDIQYGVIKTAVCQDGKLIKGYVYTDITGKPYLINEDTLEVTELPGGKAGDEGIDYYYYSTGRQVDAVTGRVWYLAREKGRWVLFDEDGNLIMRFFSESVPSISNGYLCATDETFCTVYDTAGNVVFRRHLDAGD